MKKIRRFKVHIQKRDISRFLKIKHGMARLENDVAGLIDRTVPAFQDAIAPSVMYETYSRQSIPSSLDSVLSRQQVSFPQVQEKESGTGSSGGPVETKVKTHEGVQLAFWNDCVAVTVCVITLGDHDAPCDDGPVKDALINAALEGVSHFVYGLIEGEAAQDDCSLGPCRKVDDRPVIRELANIFDLSKIQVSVNDQDEILPPYSRFILLNWISKHK